MSTKLETSTGSSALQDTTSNNVQETTKQMKDLNIKDTKNAQTKEEKQEQSDSDEILSEEIQKSVEDLENYSVKHPLQNRWTLWYDNPGKKSSAENWELNLKKIVTFDTVEDFWRIFNNIRAASKLVPGSNYHLFKENIEPKWEHSDNLKGGKWIVNVKGRGASLDQQWLWLVLGCIGEAFEEENEIMGAVVSIRKQQDRISLWTRTATNDQAQKRIGAKLKRILEIPDNMLIGYQIHADSLKRNSSFNNRPKYEL